MKKVWAVCIAALAAVTLLAGCKGKDDTYEPAASGIYVREDGSVVGADIEEFAEAYYDTAELKGFVEDEVIAYNKSTAGLSFAYAADAEEADEEAVLPVSITSLTTDSQKATLLLNYATCKDYLEFNGEANAVLTELSQQTVKEASEAGASFAGLKDAEGADADESKAQKKKKFFYLELAVSEEQDEALPVQVQGTIQFVSSNVTLTGENTATVPAGEAAIIIYK